MSCSRSLLVAILLLAPGATSPALLGAQTAPPVPVTSPPGTPPTLAPYRAPVLALVQPAAGAGGTIAALPQDRPVVVFRFAAGEADDPLDARSFLVTVDGVDRTALFQMTTMQAWGPLADAETIRRGALAAGSHHVVARICSSRGPCTTTDATLLVMPGLSTTTVLSPAASSRPLRRRVLGAIGTLTRKLLLP